MNDKFKLQFPALRQEVAGQSLVYLDGPGGTQVPWPVVEAQRHYYETSNANAHGAFITSRRTDAVVEEARALLANFLGAPSADCISLGQNMTSLNFALSRAMSYYLQPGDEVLITQLDHEANRGPWLALRSHGIVVREIPLLPSGQLDYEALQRLLNHNTRLVAMGYASNLLGTINDVQRVRQLSYQVGAWLLLDAVHYAPHFTIDVTALGADFLLCSAYKFYGPHVGVLYAKPKLLDRLPLDNLRTAGQRAPQRIETGTPNFAAIAGTTACLRFLASFGTGEDPQQQLRDAMQQIQAYEAQLLERLYKPLSSMRRVSIIGPGAQGNRTPTIALTVQGLSPKYICEELDRKQILAWNGHFYALRALEVLGLAERGGVVRLGLSAYSSEADVDRTVAAIEELVSRH